MHTHEKHIRDYLAVHLDLIEEGLRLEKVEYYLPNSTGARGFIDILARDHHKIWVVIELKRSRDSARQALNEVTKYTELLRREKSVRKDRIRSIIVSSDWHDLLTPVSNLARDWGHDLRGKKITTGPNGSVLSCETVQLLPEPFEHHPTQVHMVCFYETPEGRDRGWERIVELAEEAQAQNLVGFDFDRVAEHDRVVGNHALYYAIGRINPDLAELQAGLDVVPDEGDEDNPYYEVPASYHDCVAEYRASHHINNGGSLAVTIEIGQPDKFSALLEDPLWEMGDVRRTGAYAASDALTDRDLYDAVAGRDGQAQVLFRGSADPRVRPRWATFTKEASEPLAGNEDWSALMRAWFAEISADSDLTDVRVSIYNPCDLLQTFFWGLLDPERPFELYTPSISALAWDSSRLRRITLGALAWDGQYRPDLMKRIEMVFSDAHHYAVYHHYGEVWRHDPLLLELLGLRYVLVDMELGAAAPRVSRLQLFEDDHLQQVLGPPCESPYVRPDGKLFLLTDFVSAHRNEMHAFIGEYLKVIQPF
ncbi:endonuclease NucS [Streptomonospora nanhaiensis]|uniref:Endonuclease NucS n=1 Tax=Streptomonospora nanhaiensis TaxID=1323731 RepID=A0ABY6YU49_9ACTN|nr:endonuclease NucS domain-containing protein [Streptomonospora nanhaiensis]WAE75927.1 endonuclease NucS [Streptomonospora nanhaiensis]